MTSWALVVLAAVTGCLLPWGLSRRRWVWLFVVLCPLVVICQVVVDGARWQLVPAYLVLGVVSVAAVWARRSAHRRHHRWSRASRVCAVGLAVVVSVAVVARSWAFPVFTIPASSGPYAIGTRTYDWVDQSRQDAFVADPAARREIVVQVWYPTRQRSGRSVAYLPDPAVLAPLAGLLKLPAFIFGHRSSVRTNAHPDAVAAPGAFPVLVCLHGRGGYR